ncbi:FtsK/SpoIIIE domain-containing protein [Pseudonocardia sp. ICBG601]|uniref:FtsK/SpoIIIE domain-containing protein n=1 Tax=Pseudonocardia sp. ICBG601 TaxID=2846759 RepID=UPI001CF6BB7E|nr:FtsK/SpoIIIE domain-containing protein [Pseudonocardia sp. ICBG601]
MEQRGDVFARIELVPSDPFAAPVEDSLALVQVPVLLGRDEQGRDLVRDWASEAHMAIQGVTRSGKSRFVYGFLGQLASSPLVTVAGCDPTGLLWRPFAGSRHAPWQVSGLADIDAHEALLTRLVVDMDARIAGLPAGRDTLAVSEAEPLRLVVFEELVGLYGPPMRCRRTPGAGCGR